jgi:hypothetical protein
MTAQRLLTSLQRRGVELWMDAGRLRYRVADRRVDGRG